MDAVSEWARSQPGFVSRDLSRNAAEDKWIEVVYWASMADAETAAPCGNSAEPMSISPNIGAHR